MWEGSIGHCHFCYKGRYYVTRITLHFTRHYALTFGLGRGLAGYVFMQGGSRWYGVAFRLLDHGHGISNTELSVHLGT